MSFSQIYFFIILKTIWTFYPFIKKCWTNYRYQIFSSPFFVEVKTQYFFKCLFPGLLTVSELCIHFEELFFYFFISIFLQFITFFWKSWSVMKSHVQSRKVVILGSNTSTSTLVREALCRADTQSTCPTGLITSQVSTSNKPFCTLALHLKSSSEYDVHKKNIYGKMGISVGKYCSLGNVERKFSINFVRGS